MKPLKIIRLARGIRGISFITLIMIFSLLIGSKTTANPIILPIISEIQFNAGGYSIELELYDTEPYVLDNYRIVGLNDIGYFVPGTSYTPWEPVVVTQDDFYPPFYIDPEGDQLFVEYWYQNQWMSIDYLGITFGDLPQEYQSEVSAPNGEESIAYQLMVSMYNSECWTVKELPNTIGFNTFEVNRRAQFSGYVRNFNNQPLPYIRLKYCEDFISPSIPEITTNDLGYFYTDSMFCKKYCITFMDDAFPIATDTVFIEPDSANYFDFYIDYLPSEIRDIQGSKENISINHIPNPVTDHVWFIIENQRYPSCQNGVIKIFNPEGIVVKILPIEITGEKQEFYYHLPDDLCQGIYIYSLEMNFKKMASGKMVVSR